MRVITSVKLRIKKGIKLSKIFCPGKWIKRITPIPRKFAFDFNGLVFSEFSAKTPAAKGIRGAVLANDFFKFLNTKIINSIVFYTKNWGGTRYTISLVYYDFDFWNTRRIASR